MAEPDFDQIDALISKQSASTSELNDKLDLFAAVVGLASNSLGSLTEGVVGKLNNAFGVLADEVANADLASLGKSGKGLLDTFDNIKDELEILSDVVSETYTSIKPALNSFAERLEREAGFLDEDAESLRAHADAINASRTAQQDLLSFDQPYPGYENNFLPPQIQLQEPNESPSAPIDVREPSYDTNYLPDNIDLEKDPFAAIREGLSKGKGGGDDEPITAELVTDGMKECECPEDWLPDILHNIYQRLAEIAKLLAGRQGGGGKATKAPTKKKEEPPGFFSGQAQAALGGGLGHDLIGSLISATGAGGLGGAVSASGAAFQSVGSKVAAGYESGGGLGALGAGGGAVGAVLSSLSGIVDAAKGFVEAFAPSTVQYLGQVMRDLSAAVGSGLLPIIQVATGVFLEIGAIIKPLMDELAPIFQRLASIVGQNVIVAYEVLAQVVRALEPAFNAMADIMKLLQPLFTTLAQTVGTVLSAAASILAAALQALIPILEIMIPFFQLLADYVQVSALMLQAFINAIIGVLAGLLGGSLGDMKDVAKNLANGFRQLITMVVLLTAKFAQMLGFTSFVDELKKSINNQLAGPKKEEIGGLAAGTNASIRGYAGISQEIALRSVLAQGTIGEAEKKETAESFLKDIAGKLEGLDSKTLGTIIYEQVLAALQQLASAAATSAGKAVVSSVTEGWAGTLAAAAAAPLGPLGMIAAKKLVDG